MPPAVLDERVFERFCTILKGKAKRHIDLLSNECNTLAQQIRENDLDAVIFSSHKLRSSAGQIGAKALSACIADVEFKAHQEAGDHDFKPSDNAIFDSRSLHESLIELEALIEATNLALEHAHKKFKI